MKFYLYTLCWNEIKILPYVVEYWKLLFDKVFVYDNGSTDGSVEYLKQFEFIKVYHFDTNNRFNDFANQDIKNNIWKNTDADFVCVTDLDEILWFSDGKDKTLDRLKEYTIIKPTWYDLCRYEFPEYKEGHLIHNDCTYYKSLDNDIKTTIFQPKHISNMNYGPGAHQCNPTGDNIKNIEFPDGVYQFHLNTVGVEYKIKRKNILADRLSQQNKMHQFGTHYLFSDDNVRNDMLDKINNSTHTF